MNAGRPVQAISTIAQAIVEEPEDSRYTRVFANWLTGYRVRGLGESLERALIICFSDKAIFYPPLFPTWLAALEEKASFSFLKEIQEWKSYEEFTQRLRPPAFEKVADDPLMLAGLPVLLSRSPALEKALTYIRRRCLESFVSQPSPGPLPFLSALGLHCFFNEFVFSVSEQEQHLLPKLKDTIESTGFDGTQTPAFAALYSCYRPLFTLTSAEALQSHADTLPLLFQELMKRQVTEPAEEQNIKKEIPALTPIKNAVSQAVRQQYEDNPYPRWHSWPKADASSPQSSQSGGIAILNAGCGTGQSPISTAVLYPCAQITGLDLSLASLAYGIRKAREMGINNIRFVQGDILELGDWNEKFHVIMSGGVLHHLDDPLRGWRNLIKLLKPNGLMKIGLYSERGRQHIVKGQEWVKTSGLPPTEEGIRAFREHVFACDPSDLLKPLADLYVFYSMSNLRDLVFHIKEHRFTCLDLQSMLEQMNMRFLGFHGLPPEIKPEYLKRFPHDAAMTNLENWDKWEQEHPFTFASMYVFWCCRADETVSADLLSSRARHLLPVRGVI